MSGPRVLLMGAMGTGKTTVGTRLAVLTGWPYYDNDALLQRAVGMSAPELLDRDGEPALRRAESAALTTALTLPAPLVAGVAGGVVMDPADCARLSAGGHVVWLRARPETLVDRVGHGEGRAWLPAEHDARLAALERLVAERTPLYAGVADQVLDVDHAAPDALARAVLAAVGES